MKKYDKLKSRYRNLELEVFRSLNEEVQNSSINSKFIQGKAIKIDYKNKIELVVVNDRLCFIDNNGYHESIYNYPLEDLIDILIELKSKGRT